MRLTIVPAAALTLAVLAGPAVADAPLSAADGAWIARCGDQLKRERPDPVSVRQYCTCMHQQFEDNRPVEQTEMERLYPPMHRYCRRQAGWETRRGAPPEPLD